MATTIDTLQIEIESDSTRASQGIQNLAKSLGELKKNGTVSTAIKNLNNLSGALRSFTDASNATRSVGKLVGALAKLKEVGSVTSIGTSITKLSKSLESLEKIKVDNVAPQIERIVHAVYPLSTLKGGGLSSMVNAMAKIGKVTADLDDQKIAAFAERIQKLSDVLEPLSDKMTTIQQGLRGINSSSRSAGSAVKDMGEEVDGASVNFASFIYIVQEAVQWIQAAIQKFSQFMGQAIEWDGIAARFGRGFGSEAQETYDWIQRLNEEMGINVQQFMQYSSIYANMLTGFGVAHEDATKMALGYTELTYDIWAGYNDVYKTFEEASEAVKSAIAGEVEPIRRAGFTIIESTLQQTAANHGLNISLEKATEAQKSYLRYLTLVDQAHSQSLVGTYAKELQTAEGLMRTYAQQTKSLSQAFGSLFLPILVRVMPYIQAFVKILEEAVHWVAALFGIKIQKVDFSDYEGGSTAIDNVTDSATGATDALGDAAKAAKELKNATLGIDELNVISPPSPTSGSGGGAGGGAGGGGSGFGGLDVDSLWDESIFDGIQNQVDEIKEKLEGWLPILGTLAGALGGLALTSLLSSMGDALEKTKLLQKAFATIAIVSVEAMMVFAFADNYLESGNLLNLVGQALTTAASGYLLFKAWGASGIVLSLAVSILSQLVALKMSLADGTVSLSDKETWIQGVFSILTGALGGMYLSKHSGIFPKEGFRIGLALTSSLVLTSMRMGAIESKEIDSGSWEAWLLELGSVLTAALAGKFLGTTYYGAKGGPGGALIGATAGFALNLLTTIEAKGEDFGNNLSDWINVGITAAMVGLTAVKLWPLISGPLTTALSGLLPMIGAAISTALGGLGAAVAAVGGGWAAAAIVAVVGIIALAIADYDFTEIGHKIGEAMGKGIGAAVNWFIDIAKAVKDGFIAAWDWLVENFDLDSSWDILALFSPITWITKIVPKLWEIGKEILPGLWDGIVEGWDNFWGNVGEFISGFIQGFKDGFEIKSPSKVFAEIGSFLIEGLWEGINDKVDWIIDKISGWIDKVIDKIKGFFGIHSPSKVFAEIGGFLVDGLWGGLEDGYDTLVTNVSDWIDNLVGSIADFDFLGKLGDAWDWLKGFFTPDTDTKVEFDVAPKNNADKWWSDVKGWWNEKVGAVRNFTTGVSNGAKAWWTDVKDWWADSVGSVKNFTTGVSNGAKTWWENTTKWWGEKVGAAKSFTTSVSNEASTWWSNAKKWWSEKVGNVSNFKTGVSNSSKTWWSNTKKWWKEKAGSVSNFKTNVSNSSKTWWSNTKKWWKEKVGSVASFSVGVKNNASTWWSNVKKWWKQKAGSLSTKLNISVPKIDIEWGKVKAFGKEFSYPKDFKLDFAAAGGVFDAGSLIWAGERGAEIVANASGGKTGVMNVAQMSDAVYEGVYAAVMAANRASGGDGGGQSINVYLDGKQITAAVEKRQRERGASIMGNQVYHYG